MKFSLLSIAAAAPSIVSAWGQLGHQTVGLLAQSYLLPDTIKQVQYYLNDTSPTYMGNIATWADSYRSQPGGEFTYGYHFINAVDEGPPPDSCKITYPGDCPPEGCIVSAIANYTARLQNKRVSYEDKKDALRFLIHFIGDITQPLHTEAFGAGANDVAVQFLGRNTNLHSVWDTAIPNRMLNTTAPGFTESLGWANNLAAHVNAGKYKREIRDWVKYSDVRDHKDGAAKSAAKWAQESNTYVCAYALKDGPAAINGTEIGGAYYDGSVSIIDMQVAKGGIRLAAWLNMIFEGKTGF